MSAASSGRRSPPRASALLAVAVTAACLGGLAAATGLVRLTGVAALTGVVTAAAALAGARGTAPWLCLSSLLLVPCVVLLSGAAVLAALVPAEPFNVTVFPSHAWPFVYLLWALLAAAGATALPRQDLATAAGRSFALTAAAVTATLGTTVAAAVATPTVPRTAAAALVGRAVVPPPGAGAVASLLLVAGAALGAVGLALSRLPVSALVARGRRAAVRSRLRRLRRGLLAVGAATAAPGGVLAAVPTALGALPDPTASALVAAGTAVPLRVALLAVGGFAASAAGLVALLRRLRVGAVRRLLRLAARAAGGAVLLAAVLVPGPDRAVGLLETVYRAYGADTELEVLRSVVAEFGAAAVVVGALAAACLTVAVLVAAGCLLARLRVLPPRTAGAVVAAVGLGGAAVVAGELSGPTPLLAVVVGGAVLAWDLGTYGQRLRTELRQGSRRLELVHAGTVLSVAGVGVAVSHGLLRVVEALGSPGTAAAAVAAVAALAGVVLVAAAARG